MNSAPEPERPNRPETPTADAVSEFLSGVKEIHERQRTESLVDPDSARIQAREFAQTEEEIIQILKTFPNPEAGDDDTYTDEVYPGVLVTGGPREHTPELVGIYTDEANLPFNPLLIEGVKLGSVGSIEGILTEQGVSSNYFLEFEANTHPDYPPLFQDQPIPGRPKPYFLRFYFDEFGNYLKTIFTFDDLELELEELQSRNEVVKPEQFLRQELKDSEAMLRSIFGDGVDLGLDDLEPDELEELSAELGPPMRAKHYKGKMTPGDFELVGFSLKLLKDKLAKASEES